MGSAPLSPTLREIKQLLCVKNLILYYIKQIDSMLPCICPLIDHRGHQNVVRTSVTHSAIASCATFLFLPHFDVICDLLKDRCTTTWNLFVKYRIYLNKRTLWTPSFLNAAHFSECSAFFQEWRTVPSVRSFLSVGHFSKCAASFQVCAFVQVHHFFH